MTLLNLTAQDAPTRDISTPTNSGNNSTRNKKWYIYAPLALAVSLIFIPQPSFALMLYSHYLKMHHYPGAFAIHLTCVYGLILLTLSSLTICVTRDPGSVTPRQKPTRRRSRDRDEELEHALLSGGDDMMHDDSDNEGDLLSLAEIEDLTSKGRWCKKCERRRPERAHHCSLCGRCILKMDHHCPWLGGNCVGHRTYPAFIHFLLMCTLLPLYITFIAGSVLLSLIKDPFSADPDVSPLHALFLFFAGATFTLVMGSFVAYHMYLITINQTTLEHLSTYELLRQLPAPPSSSRPTPPPPSSPLPHQKSPPSLAHPPTPTGSDFDSPIEPSHGFALYPYPSSRDILNSSNPPPLRYRPPEEHELTHSQRRLIRYYHSRIRMYDLGWQKNWWEVFGGKVTRPRWKWWVRLLAFGGWPRGDGWTFEKAQGVSQRLERLAKELDDLGKRERQERVTR